MSTASRTGLLGIDTSGACAVVVGSGPAGVAVRRSTEERAHGGSLLTLVDDVLRTCGLEPASIAAIGVVTGPGSFTGLRVGLSFAKALAWADRIPLVGIDGAEVLRRSAAAVVGLEALAAAVVRPAGTRDHYLSAPGRPPAIVPPGIDPVEAAPDLPVIAVGGAGIGAAPSRGLAGHAPDALGRIAEDGAGDALLAIVRERIADGARSDGLTGDDAATVEPVYVAPPRGVPDAAGAAWEPAL